MFGFTGWDVIPPVLGIGGCKKKARLGGDQFIMAGPEDRQDQIRIGVAAFMAGVMAGDWVFVILIVSMGWIVVRRGW